MSKYRIGTLYKRGNVWWLRYMVGGKYVFQSLETTSKEEAENKRKDTMRPILAAEKADALAVIVGRMKEAKSEQARAEEMANPPLELAQAWDAYSASKFRPDSSERTLSGYESTLKRFIRWLTDTHPNVRAIKDVTDRIAFSYADQLQSEGVTASTFNQHIGFLRLLWRTLAKDIRSESNPWMDIRRRKLASQRLAHRHRNLTPEQFDSLLKSAGGTNMHDLLFTLGWTGQRLADVVLLRWDCIDFKRKVISVHPLKLRRTGKEVHIPLLPALADLLKMRKRNAIGPYVFPDLVEEYQRNRTAISKHIQDAFKSAELTPRDTMPNISRAVVVYGSHSLRHYFATQALAAGMPAEIVKRITGHTSDAMLAHYQHVDARLIGELANKLAAKPVEKSKPLPAPEADNTPLPAWALKMLNTMTADNWKTVRKEMKKVGKQKQKQAGTQNLLLAAPDSPPEKK